MIIKDFDKRIKSLREEKGISQAELAKRLYITRGAVNAWETGKAIPSIDKLMDLARFFRVSTDFLLGIEQKETIDITSLREHEKGIIQRLLYYMDYLRNEDISDFVNKNKNKKKGSSKKNN